MNAVDGELNEREAAAQDLERELTVLLGMARRVSSAFARRIHPELDSTSYALMLQLHDTGPARAAELAERAGLDKSTISRQLTRLSGLGLIERLADPADGRARIVRLTDLGQQRLDEVRTDRRRRLRARIATWPTPEVRSLSAMLSRLNDDLNDER